MKIEESGFVRAGKTEWFISRLENEYDFSLNKLDSYIQFFQPQNRELGTLRIDKMNISGWPNCVKIYRIEEDEITHDWIFHVTPENEWYPIGSLRPMYYDHHAILHGWKPTKHDLRVQRLASEMSAAQVGLLTEEGWLKSEQVKTEMH